MPHNRPCWDLTATLYAVEGADWFTVSEPGKITVGEGGVVSFTPDAEGDRHYISVNDEQAAAIKQHFVDIMTRKPASRQ